MNLLQQDAKKLSIQGDALLINKMYYLPISDFFTINVFNLRIWNSAVSRAQI